MTNHHDAATSLRKILRRSALRLLKPPHIAYLIRLPLNASVLDVGCGNNSPSKAKSIRPDIYYVGVDVQEFNLSPADHVAADELTLLPAHEFASQLRQKFEGRRFDLVFLKHVIEHTHQHRELLQVLPGLLKDGGYLYISCPSEASIAFPSADGTLNFFDDPTHVYIPSAREMLNALATAELRPVEVHLRYRHAVLAVLGVVYVAIQWVLWPVRRRISANALVWSLFGFESILVLRKSASR